MLYNLQTSSRTSSQDFVIVAVPRGNVDRDSSIEEFPAHQIRKVSNALNKNAWISSGVGAKAGVLDKPDTHAKLSRVMTEFASDGYNTAGS